MDWENTKTPHQEKEHRKEDEWLKGSLGADLKILVNNEKFSDVSFLVGEDKIQMWALKGILSARSKVFCRMFEGGFCEGSMQSIPLPDLDPGLFLKTLDYVYTGNLVFDVEDVVDLYAVADRYFIPSLMDECMGKIEQNLTPDNVTVLYEKAGDGNQEVLRERCFRFIMERAEEVFTTEQWTRTNVEDVLAIIRSEVLSVPEIYLLKAVLRWGGIALVRHEDLMDQSSSGYPPSSPQADPSMLCASASHVLVPCSPPCDTQVVAISTETSQEDLRRVLDEIRLPLIPPLFLRDLVEPLSKAGFVPFDKLLEAYRFHADSSLVGPLESARLRNHLSPVLAPDGSVNVVRVPFQEFNVVPGKYFKKVSPEIDCLVGCHWQLILKNKLNPNNLSLYVKCNVAKTLPFGHAWRVRDQGMKFGIINQLNRTKSIWKSWHKYGETDTKPWRPSKTRYGFGYVMKLSTLLDPQAGFLVNNCLVMEVRVPTMVTVETVVA